VAWVLLRNGTAFVAVPGADLPAEADFDALGSAAKEALAELGPVVAGTPSADFSVSKLDAWFPGDGWWFVTYDHPSIVTVLHAPGSTEVAVGFVARAERQADFDRPEIVLVRDFAGRTWTEGAEA
jgi:hypothetical protein